MSAAICNLGKVVFGQKYFWREGEGLPRAKRRGYRLDFLRSMGKKRPLAPASGRAGGLGAAIPEAKAAVLKLVPKLGLGTRK